MLVPVLRSRSYLSEAEHYAIVKGGKRAKHVAETARKRVAKERAEERRKEQLRIDEISRDLHLLEDVFGTPHANQQAELEALWGN